MRQRLRSLARRLLGVRRIPTYYLPWLTRPGLGCTLLLSNVEARFDPACRQGPFTLTVGQHDADGRRVREHQVRLEDASDTVELPIEPTPAGCGFATVQGERVRSDLYVTLTEGGAYAATHGRGEFIEHYPWPSRLLLATAGGALGLIGRSLAVFARDQYAYVGPESRSHFLLMNLSNVTNRISVAASRNGVTLGRRRLCLRPMGAHLLDITELAGSGTERLEAYRLRVEANAWFNLYLVGAGSRDVAGPLSLMHVK
jgi:hypothetical protein